MSIQTLLTGGLGNGIFAGSPSDIVTRGYLAGEALGASKPQLFTHGFGNGVFDGDIAGITTFGFLGGTIPDPETGDLCPSVTFDISDPCISRAMISGEVDIVGWDYTEGANCIDGTAIATNATWEILSGTAITLGDHSFNDATKIAASFITASEVGKASVKTTVYLDDERVVCGVINYKVYEC